MPHIRIETVLAAPPSAVWEDIADLGSHVEWMQDALDIRFTSVTKSGVGTSFTCRTKVGPLRLTDLMSVTEWTPERALGIRHDGLVTGVGRFTLEPASDERTRFSWDEQLRFPWWLGGAVTGVFARPVLRRIWQRNLARLAARFGRPAAAG